MTLVAGPTGQCDPTGTRGPFVVKSLRSGDCALIFNVEPSAVVPRLAERARQSEPRAQVRSWRRSPSTCPA